MLYNLMIAFVFQLVHSTETKNNYLQKTKRKLNERTSRFVLQLEKCHEHNSNKTLHRITQQIK